MALFSTSYHIAGIRGMPRRVYSGALSGDYGADWLGLTRIAAAGAVILLISAWSFVAVALATWLGKKETQAVAFEFARPLRPPVYSYWDRYGLWTVLAVILILAAYAYPLIQLIAHPRYGSPPYQPF